jgi:transposase
MKHAEEIVNILEAFDLTRSYESAGKLAGCDPKTVAHWVARRDAGELSPMSVPRGQLIDPYVEKLEEWMEASNGKIRADVAHDKLVAMGYPGSERTTRRAVAVARSGYRAGHRRVHRPWVPEPGLWFQYDFGDGPVVESVKAVLFCAWLAWCRFRVVLAIRDKTLPTVVACIDQSLRRFGGCPTYALTDNEKTVTVDHVARIAIRNPEMVAAARHYGLTVVTCMPADPASKGGSEATVRVAKADLVPTEANLLPVYDHWATLRRRASSSARRSTPGRIG